MGAIKIKKGLNIPINGKPAGDVKALFASEKKSTPSLYSLNLSPFQEEKFSLLVKLGESVKLGDPLLEDRSCPGRFFVSPAGGKILRIDRGEKRVLKNIVIESSSQEEIKKFDPIDPLQSTKDQILKRWMEGGGFSHIRKRPFNHLADPRHLPRTIFVKGLESYPFHPRAEMFVQGHEHLFQVGLDGLKKITDGLVHLVFSHDSTSKAFLEAKNVQKHTAEGPHPVGTLSLHLQEIDPVRSAQDIIWTLSVHDVIVLGSLLYDGKYFVERVIGIGGPGALLSHTGFYKVREGEAVRTLISGRLNALEDPVRIISGDPLIGRAVDENDFLGFDDYALSLIPENEKRKMLHFFRLGDDYTTTHAYLSGFLKRNKPFDFTTNQHGERRYFIDPSQYDSVQPLNIPTVHLVKAVMAGDFELAEKLGLLHVVPEDFTLPTFVDMSKIPMDDIIDKGLKAYAKEVLH